MKLFSFATKKSTKNARAKRIFADYYQESINNYGRKQIKSLLDKGLSVQW
jgi:hypothetical protein